MHMLPSGKLSTHFKLDLEFLFREHPSPACFRHPADCQSKSRCSHVNGSLFGNSPHCRVGLAHRVGKFLVDPILLPAKLLDILGPLEIANRHAARVGEDVGDDQHAALDQCLVRSR